MDYTGYKEVELSESELAGLYAGEYSAIPFARNEYMIAKHKDEIVDYFRFNGACMERVLYPTIDSQIVGTIKPRNPQQVCAMDMLRDRSVPVKVLRGVYGSGKDFLMFNAAVELVRQEEFNKIIYLRPHIDVADMPALGALPGEASEKLAWTLAPLYDQAGGEHIIHQMVGKGQLEMVPMNFLRGRSFEKAIVYMTEGQNMTKRVAQLVIGRIGEDSELWINADSHQTDRKIFDTDNGVGAMVENLRDDGLFGYVYLPKTERSRVARLADKLD